MKGSPYHVEILTWKTEAEGGRGVVNLAQSMMQNENVGHASMEISFPFSIETQGWVKQYCKGIKLYEPSADSPTKDDERYTADVPVHYSTSEGETVSDPLEYLKIHPNAQLVTHVYLSWVPGNFAAKRDERDPFAGKHIRGFHLFDAHHDRVMEHASEHVSLRRGYQGVQEIEYKEQDSSAIDETATFISRGLHEVVHNMTPLETRYYAFTPGERDFIEEINGLHETLDGLGLQVEPKEYLKSLVKNIESEWENTVDKENIEPFSNKIFGIYVVNDYLNIYQKLYCKEHGIEDYDFTDDQFKDMIKKFIPHQLISLMNTSIIYYDDVDLVKRQEKLQFYAPIYNIVESGQPNIREIVSQIEDNTRALNELPNKTAAANMMLAEYRDEFINKLEKMVKRQEKVIIELNMKIENLYKAYNQSADDPERDIVAELLAAEDELFKLENIVKCDRKKITDAPLKLQEASMSLAQVKNEEANLLMELALLRKYPAAQIFFERYADVHFTEDTLDEYFESKFLGAAKEYIELTKDEKMAEELKNRYQRTSIDSEADFRVVIPIADVAGYKGHPDGLNVHDMLKKVSDVVGQGQGYALNYFNCSDFVQTIALAGAPDNLKPIMDRHAMGVAVTPQVINNGAQSYASTILDVDYKPKEHKISFMFKLVHNIEKKAALASKTMLSLKEKNKSQDAVIDKILEGPTRDKVATRLASDMRNDENFKEMFFDEQSDIDKHKDLIFATMSKLYSEIYSKKKPKNKKETINDDLEKKGELFDLAKKQILKEAIYQYCDKKYQNNIQEDKDRLYPQIKESKGLFLQIAQNNPNPLSDEQILKKMKVLYKSIYGNKPLFGKDKKILQDFKESGPLYMHACHTIIFENARGVDNITDPGFVSMKKERDKQKAAMRSLVINVVLSASVKSMGSIFVSRSSASDPFHEIKSLHKFTSLMLDKMVGKSSSRTKLAFNVFRYALLVPLAAVHAVLVAPRRAIINFRTTAVVNKGKIAAQSSEQQFYDQRFAFMTGKVGDDVLIKNLIRQHLKENLESKKITRKIRREIEKKVEHSFNAKDQVFQDAAAAFHNEVTPQLQELKEKSLLNIEAHTNTQSHIKENLVPIKIKDTEVAFLAFNSALKEGKVPYFDDKSQDAILRKILHVDELVYKEDRRDIKLIKPKIINKLEQFKMMKMAVKGVARDDLFGTFARFDPEHAKPIIPLNIQNTTEANDIRQYFKDEIEKYKSTFEVEDSPDLDQEELAELKEEAEERLHEQLHLLLTPKELDKMSDKALLAAVRYMSQPSYADILLAFEKKIVKEALSNPDSTQLVLQFGKNNLPEFKQFLRTNKLDEQIISLLENNAVLADFATKLKYATCSAQVTQSLEHIQKQSVRGSLRFLNPQQGRSSLQGQAKMSRLQTEVNVESPNSINENRVRSVQNLSAKVAASKLEANSTNEDFKLVATMMVNGDSDLRRTVTNQIKDDAIYNKLISSYTFLITTQYLINPDANLQQMHTLLFKTPEKVQAYVESVIRKLVTEPVLNDIKVTVQQKVAEAEKAPVSPIKTVVTPHKPGP